MGCILFTINGRHCLLRENVATNGLTFLLPFRLPFRLCVGLCVCAKHPLVIAPGATCYYKYSNTRTIQQNQIEEKRKKRMASIEVYVGDVIAGKQFYIIGATYQNPTVKLQAPHLDRLVCMYLSQIYIYTNKTKKTL